MLVLYMSFIDDEIHRRLFEEYTSPTGSRCSLLPAPC